MNARLARVAVLMVALCAATTASAATTVRLPVWLCAHPDALLVDGFQGADAVARRPSAGSGGSAPGVQSRSVTVPGYGTHTYHLYVPTRHASIRPMPVVMALHGAAGSPADAQLAAQWLRDDWSAAAEAGGFVIVVPAATGASGGWIVPPPAPSDYDILEAVFADLEGAYDIDRSRRIGWGFSAGAHVMHDLAFNRFSEYINLDTLAAYAIGAGAMQALACSGPTSCSTMIATAAATRRIPVSLHIGTSDPLLSYATADHQRLLDHGWVDGQTVFYTPFVGGHEYHSGHLTQVWADLCPFQVQP